MTEKNIADYSVNDEIDRYFDDSSLVGEGQPTIMIIMGGVAAGKTSFRKQSFDSGYVVVDSVEIFLSLCRGEYFDFPGPFEDLMEVIGGLVAKRAIDERRNIVTEIIGSDYEPTNKLIKSMTSAGYSVGVRFIECDLEESLKRSENRDDDCISAFYAEKYQRKWLIDAAKSADIVDTNRSKGV